MNRWIFIGTLGAVFLITLGFSYGPGYGGSLLAFLSNDSSSSPTVSPGDMVTPVVTLKKMVTLKTVTNVTNVPPLMSPLALPNDSQYYSVSPSVSPVTSYGVTMSPSPTAVQSVSPSPVVTSPQPEAGTAPPTETPSPTLTPPQSNKININTAGKIDLMTLKGIKDVKSDAVIQYRESHGPFEKIEDIMNVSGIGQVTFDGIKDQITVGP